MFKASKVLGFTAAFAMTAMAAAPALAYETIKPLKPAYETIKPLNPGYETIKPLTPA